MAKSKFSPVTINGVSFTAKQHEALVTSAIESADNLGYCDESHHVLEDMGLTVPNSEVTVTLTLRIIDLDRTTVDSLDNRFAWTAEYSNDYGADIEVESVTVS